MKHALLFGLCLFAGLAAASCSTSSTNTPAGCTAGERLACNCENGGSGIRSCDAAGAYGLCDCSATTDAGSTQPDPVRDAGSSIEPPDSGTVPQDTTPDASTPALLALYAPCQADTECASNFCYLYNDGAHLCTKTCVSSADCPAPSLGCNTRNVCKDPK